MKKRKLVYNVKKAPPFGERKGGADMLPATRRQQIVELIQEKKSATVTEMAKLFDITAETIRRDLKVLERDGLLMRTHGGAFIQSGVENLVDTDIRMRVYIPEKTKIARIARQFVSNGDTIFLDNSTTDYYIARELREMRITVATNNLSIVQELADCGNIQLICIGGTFSRKENAFNGMMTTDILQQLYFDKAFISCRSVSIEGGLTESTEKWCAIRKIAISRSKCTFLAADFSKFDQNSFAKVGDLSSIHAIITDSPLSPRWHQAMDAIGCKIYDT